MKKLFTLSAITSLITLITLGQDTTMSHINIEKRQLAAGYITMQKGKMITIKDGKIELMENDILLPNGTTVSTGGTVKSFDGSATQLKEGERLDMEGKLIISENPLNPDSSIIKPVTFVQQASFICKKSYINKNLSS